MTPNIISRVHTNSIIKYQKKNRVELTGSWGGRESSALRNMY